MNEQEAIKLLVTLQDNINNVEHFDEVQEIINWLQRRADILAVAESDPEFQENEMPYVYDLAQAMRRQAHIELESAMIYPDMEFCFKQAIHYGNLAKKYFQQANEWKDGKSINTEKE